MNKGNKVKAEIATVQLGSVEIEGLYAEGIDKFGVAVPQVCNLFQFLKKNANRDIKTILGEDFQFLKWCSKLNPKSVNVILLPDFEKLLFELALKQNTTAIEISRDLIGLSLHQLFSDAFNIHFEKEQREKWQYQRKQGKLARRTLTDALAEYIIQHPGMSDNAKTFLYANITNKIYQGIFARTAGKLRKDWDIMKSNENPRDKMTERELIYLLEVEELVMRLVDMGWEPYEAVECALNRLMIPVVER
jgi:hypothetical protein